VQEGFPAFGVEAVDGLDGRDQRDLGQVVEVFTAIREPHRRPACEGETALDDLVPTPQALGVILGQFVHASEMPSGRRVEVRRGGIGVLLRAGVELVVDLLLCRGHDYCHLRQSARSAVGLAPNLRCFRYWHPLLECRTARFG